MERIDTCLDVYASLLIMIDWTNNRQERNPEAAGLCETTESQNRTSKLPLESLRASAFTTLFLVRGGCPEVLPNVSCGMDIGL